VSHLFGLILLSLFCSLSLPLELQCFNQVCLLLMKNLLLIMNLKDLLHHISIMFAVLIVNKTSYNAVCVMCALHC